MNRLGLLFIAAIVCIASMTAARADHYKIAVGAYLGCLEQADTAYKRFLEIGYDGAHGTAHSVFGVTGEALCIQLIDKICRAGSSDDQAACFEGVIMPLRQDIDAILKSLPPVDRIVERHRRSYARAMRHANGETDPDTSNATSQAQAALLRVFQRHYGARLAHRVLLKQQNEQTE